MSIKRLALPIILLAAVIATTTACTLFGPSQAERDMAKTIEVYRVLEEHYVDRNNLDVTALNEGAVSGLLEGLGISSEGFDPRVILSTMELEDLDGLLAVYESLEDSYFSRDDVDLDALNESALTSMLAALDDPFTGYHAPRAYSHVTGELIDGTFSGIGAEVTMVDGLPTIVSPRCPTRRRSGPAFSPATCSSRSMGRPSRGSPSGKPSTSSAAPRAPSPRLQCAGKAPKSQSSSKSSATPSSARPSRSTISTASPASASRTSPIQATSSSNAPSKT